MMDPHGTNDAEAKSIDRQFRLSGLQQARPNLPVGRGLGQLQLEHHDGNDDGNNTVAECGKPLSARAICARNAAMLSVHPELLPASNGSAANRYARSGGAAKSIVRDCRAPWLCLATPSSSTWPSSR